MVNMMMNDPFVRQLDIISLWMLWLAKDAY